MIDFAEKTRILRKANEVIKNIDSKEYEQYEEVSKIDELEVAKIVIKRLLDRLER